MWQKERPYGLDYIPLWGMCQEDTIYFLRKKKASAPMYESLVCSNILICSFPKQDLLRCGLQ